MALKLNNQPKKPNGPERESSKYTTNPTTTEGTAKKVLSTVSTAPRPTKRATPSQAPSTMPMQQASAHAVALTANERHTMDRRVGSHAATSWSAVLALSVSVAIRKNETWGIVAIDSISSDMKRRA
jgi:hypothetical protein